MMRVVAIALALVVAGCGSSVSDKAGGRATAGSTQTLRLRTSSHGHGGYFPINTKDKPAGAPFAGFAKTDPLDDASGGSAGSQDTLCVHGGIANRQNCTVTLTLKRGTIVADGVFTDGGGYGGTLAITGGTGVYAGARGTYEASVPGPNPQAILVRLLLP